jgi:hypothetical protein
MRCDANVGGSTSSPTMSRSMATNIGSLRAGTGECDASGAMRATDALNEAGGNINSLRPHCSAPTLYRADKSRSIMTKPRFATSLANAQRRARLVLAWGICFLPHGFGGLLPASDASLGLASSFAPMMSAGSRRDQGCPPLTSAAGSGNARTENDATC